MSEKRSGRGAVLAEHLFSALSSACVPATLFVSVSIDKCCLMCGITAVWLGHKRLKSEKSHQRHPQCLMLFHMFWAARVLH